MVHIQNKDIIYDTKLKKSKNKPFWGKNIQIPWLIS